MKKSKKTFPKCPSDIPMGTGVRLKRNAFLHPDMAVADKQHATQLGATKHKAGTIMQVATMGGCTIHLYAPPRTTQPSPFDTPKRLAVVTLDQFYRLFEPV